MSQAKPRVKRGILGVPQDPSQKLLFSFKGESWPSDDSGDSDYSPTSPAPKTKRTRNESSQKQQAPIPQTTASTPSLRSGVSETSKDNLAPAKGSLCVTFKSVDADSQAVNGVNIPGVIFVPKPKPKQQRNNDASGIEVPAPKKRGPKPKDGSHSEPKEFLKGNATKKRKRKKHDEESNTSASETASNEGDEASAEEVKIENPQWGKIIPMEILVKIFSHVVRSDGVFPFLSRAALVCKLWKDASEELLLWEKVDLSRGRVKYSESLLVQLCKKCLSHTKELNLAGWGSALTLRGINVIAKCCPLLSTINLSHCTKITSECLRILADSCPLANIDLSGSWRSFNSLNSPVSLASLKYLLSKCGSQLTHINIAENEFVGYQSIITAISESCPNLLVLDTSNPCIGTRNMVLPLEKLQHGCPQLRVLRIANAPLSFAATSYHLQAQSPGFPNLEELSIAVDPENLFGFSDSGFERIVKSSHKLKLLDVRGCRNISVSGLVRVPAWDIQQLYLSQCSATRTSDLELVLQKWRHSLIEVDLSWVVNEEAVNQAALALATAECETPLRHLDLCGSAVSYKTVKTLLSGCPNLCKLNLQSCRGLPRGMKRLHSFEDLERLREEVRDGRFE